jgi:hypothetical protein
LNDDGGGLRLRELAGQSKTRMGCVWQHPTREQVERLFLRQPGGSASDGVDVFRKSRFAEDLSGDAPGQRSGRTIHNIQEDNGKRQGQQVEQPSYPPLISLEKSHRLRHHGTPSPSGDPAGAR